MSSRIDGDLYVAGSISANSVTPTAGSVGDTTVAANAAIDSDKLQHMNDYGTDFGIAWDAAPAADDEFVVHTLKNAGTLRGFHALLGDTGSSSDIKFDLKRAAAGSNSFATMLSATADFTNADTDATKKSGTLSATALAAGDRLRIDMDYTSATGVQGPYAWAELDETPS